MLQQNAGASMEVKALDRTRTTVLDTGVFASLDNQVDIQTGTVRAKARFNNAQLALFPSQFVNVQLNVRTVKDAVVVPVAAVRHGGTGDYVFVLNDDRTVALRPVTRGQATADKVQIATGLQVGERVITEGADRLRDGSRVMLPGDAPAAGGAARARGAGARPLPHRRVARWMRRPRRRRPRPRAAARAAVRCRCRPHATAAGALPGQRQGARRPRTPQGVRPRSTRRPAALERGSASATQPRRPGPRNEPVAPLHPAAGCDLAADAGHRAGGHRRAALPAAVGPAAGGLSHHPGADPVPRRQPGSDGANRHGAAGAAVRPDAGPLAHELDQRGRRLHRHPAIRPGPGAGRGRAAGAGRDQRGRLPAAGRPAGAARLREGQPGRCAGAHAGDHVRHAAADRSAEHCQHPAGAEDQPGDAASGWSRCPAASGRRFASRSTPARWLRTASPWTTCERRSPPPMPTAPRAASTARPAPIRSIPTTSFWPRPTTRT